MSGSINILQSSFSVIILDICVGLLVDVIEIQVFSVNLIAVVS